MHRNVLHARARITLCNKINHIPSENQTKNVSMIRSVQSLTEICKKWLWFVCIFRGSTNFVDYLKKKLDGVDQRLCDLEYGSKHSDKDSMDLKTTKNALDQHKVDWPQFFILLLKMLTYFYPLNAINFLSFLTAGMTFYEQRLLLCDRKVCYKFHFKKENPFTNNYLVCKPTAEIYYNSRNKSVDMAGISLHERHYFTCQSRV